MTGLFSRYQHGHSMSKLVSLVLICCLFLHVIFARDIEYSSDDVSRETASINPDNRIEYLANNASHFFDLMKHTTIGKKFLDPNTVMGCILGTNNEQKLEQNLKTMASMANQLIKSVKRSGWKETLTPLKGKAIDWICEIIASAMRGPGDNMVVLDREERGDRRSRREPISFANLML